MILSKKHSTRFFHLSSEVLILVFSSINLTKYLMNIHSNDVFKLITNTLFKYIEFKNSFACNAYTLIAGNIKFQII
jgi:hypothetical protein